MPLTMGYHFEILKLHNNQLDHHTYELISNKNFCLGIHFHSGARKYVKRSFQEKKFFRWLEILESFYSHFSLFYMML